VIDQALVNDAKRMGVAGVYEGIASRRIDLTAVPDCRAKSLALTKLDEAEMWIEHAGGYVEAVKKIQESDMWSQRARFPQGNST
jgi:hypothetical protein